MEDIIRELVHDEDRLLLLIGGGVFALWITVASITKVAMSFSQERTKREIAAYIAEGTMSPEQGERLLKAGKRNNSGCA